jgi:hypothetical protein
MVNQGQPWSTLVSQSQLTNQPLRVPIGPEPKFNPNPDLLDLEGRRRGLVVEVEVERG